MEPKFSVLNQTLQKVQSKVREVLENHTLEGTGAIQRDLCSETVNYTDYNVRMHLLVADFQ